MTDIGFSIEDFDESTYLALNPDVFEAVQRGLFPSGLAHFIAHGRDENRPGTPTRLLSRPQNMPEHGLTGALPPEDLRVRVHGNADLSSFEAVGKVVADDIYGAIYPTLKLSEHSHILDFGCGCGRVIRYFHKLCGNVFFYGTDIDKEAISWCESHLSEIGKFFTNKESPPLEFDDGFFDFIYSISIFTHLPEDMQFAWLEELRRVAKPGGYLLLTTH